MFTQAAEAWKNASEEAKAAAAEKEKEQYEKASIEAQHQAWLLQSRHEEAEAAATPAVAASQDTAAQLAMQVIYLS